MADEPKTSRPPYTLDLLPLKMRETPHWCLFRLVWNETDKKFRKLPQQVHRPEYGASSTKQEHWASFEDAVKAYESGVMCGRRDDDAGLDPQPADGVGWFFKQPFFGFDLDHVRDKETKETEPWALQVIAKYPTYVELSVSETGYHGIGEGPYPVIEVPIIPDQPDSPKKQKPAVYKGPRVEVYGGLRFFACTGWRQDGPKEVEPFRAATVTELLKSAPTWDPQARPEPVKSAASDKVFYPLGPQKLQDILSGDWRKYCNDDHSALRLPVLSTLCYNTRLDAERAESEFRQSQYFRDWDKQDHWERLRKEELPKAMASARACIDSLLPKPKETINPDSWPDLFETYEETINEPPPSWLITGFAEELDAVMYGGLSGHGKTLLMLSTVKALLTGEPLFGHAAFSVPAQGHKVMYLVPESQRRLFIRRLKLFGLVEFVKDGRLIYRTLSKGLTIPLTDPRILRAAEGRNVFLDTAIRFSDGEENSASDNQKGLAESIFGLQRAGARSVWGAHHSPKSFEKDNYMSLPNCLRGSGDIGAMLSTVYGVKLLDKKRVLIFVENIKPRDIDPPPPFQVEGRPWIDNTGNFKMVKAPGECGPLAVEMQVNSPRSPETDDQAAQAVKLRAEGKSHNEIAKELQKLGYNISGKTVGRRLKEYDKEQANKSQQNMDDDFKRPEGV